MNEQEYFDVLGEYLNKPKSNYKELIKNLCKKYKIEEKEINVRADGRIEWICEDGVGHTIYSKDGNYSHGCDGCCSKLKIEF